MSHALAAAVLCLSFVLTDCGSNSPKSSDNNPNSTAASPSTSTSSSAPCPTPADAGLKIVITAPCNETKVAQRHFVEGVVSDSNAQVLVVIHPMENADYWVQPNVTVRDKGKWKVLSYFGEPGAQHSGKHYEVQSFVNPKDTLREGQLLSGWPQAESKSQPIEVIRE
jgi:hypothetical protein